MIYREIYKSALNTENPEIVKRDAMKPWQRRVKRGVDILTSAVGLVALSPFMGIISVCLKLQNDGPIIFSQERIGMGGKPFTIYKFRTMTVKAEPEGPQLAVKEDDRTTTVGKFLREHHLDELPQLWNVLKGDMSMVGPRPERQYFIDKIMKYDSRYRYLYEIRPGVTSEATSHNGYTDTMEKMLKRLDRDLYYLENRSLLMDWKIMAETGSSILFGKKF